LFGIRMKKRRNFGHLLITGILLLAAISVSAQDVDPFYLNVFEKAQKSFLAKNYAEAAQDFEIAAFGLGGNGDLQAKAYVYLGLCRYYLKDMPASEKSFRQAEAIMGDRGFASLEIYESAWPDLDKLIAFFNLTRSQTPELPKEVKKPEPAPDADPVGTKPNTAAKKTDGKAAKDSGKKNPRESEKSTPSELKLDKIKEGDLVPLDLVESPPLVIKRIPAAYPEHARSLGIEGTVTINALVSEKGNVIDTKILENIKNAVGFDRAAIQAVRGWKFEPATVNGIKVKVWIPVAVEFKKNSPLP
jgi:periplasmic protein TonB